MIPRIGVEMNYHAQTDHRQRAYLDSYYLDFLTDKGALAIPIPPTENPTLLAESLNSFHGVLFTGGMDLDPSLWNEPCHEKTIKVHPRRQNFDFMLYQAVRQRQLPIMAICLGFQMINVFHNGTLHQHLPQHPGKIDHGTGTNTTHHDLNVNPDSILHQWLKTDRIEVMSHHHQGLDRLGDGLLAAATADDGIIEALEAPGYPFLTAVQWHPEREAQHPVNSVIVDQFIAAARAFAFKISNSK